MGCEDCLPGIGLEGFGHARRTGRPGVAASLSPQLHVRRADRPGVAASLSPNFTHGREVPAPLLPNFTYGCEVR